MHEQQTGSGGPSYTAGTYTTDGGGRGGTTHTGRSGPSGRASIGSGGGGGGGWGGGSDPYGYHGYTRPVPTVDIPAEEKEMVLSTFKKWDIAGNNYISKKELANVLVNLGVEKKSTDAIFQQADWNNDGRIEYKEFVYWLYGGKAPRAIVDKALAPTFKVVVQELMVSLPGDASAKPFVRWRDNFTKQIICTSPEGPVAPAKIDLGAKAKSAPIIFDIPSDLKAVGVEVCTSGMLWGSSVIGVAQLQLGGVAKAMATGLGQVQNLEIPIIKEGSDLPGKKPLEVGKVHMSLTEANDGDATWAEAIVKEWKSSGLPELPSFAEVMGVLETLIIKGERSLETTLCGVVDSMANKAIADFSSWSPEQASKELDNLADWMIKLKTTARKSSTSYDTVGRGFTQTRESLVSRIIDNVLTGEPNFRLLKLALKFANRLDETNRDTYKLEKTFKDVLKFPDNARMDDLMAAPDADLAQLQPPDLGLILATNNEEPPRCDDHTRFQVRDDTAERVLRMLGCTERLHYSLGLTYERLAVETISDSGFKVPEQVALLLKKICVFPGEPDASMLSLAQHITARKRDWEALIGRFDVVAQPVIAEYDKSFKPLGPTAELPSGFFGEPQVDPASGMQIAGPLTQIGGKGWFWVLHAAAMNIGESSRAEDFEEYSIAPDTKYKGNWASQRSLDETKYICDMTNLWMRSMEAAVHLNIQDMVMFPFGMGAFLRNLHQLDGYYSEPEPRRRLRKGVAKGLFISLAGLAKAGKSLRIHVCLVDTGLESRVNHNVFIEAAADVCREMPNLKLQELIRFHRNCDALELARTLASSDGPADQVRPVGMLNGANNKLLGNHWFAQGARSAIDENLHRRCGAMCLGSLMMNLATAPHDRSLQELTKTVRLIGGQVIDLKPYPVALGPSRCPGRFFSRINVKPYGVLGMQLQVHHTAKPPQQVRAAPEPGPEVVVVDPTALQIIQKGPSGAAGVSQDIYRWLGIQADAAFPDALKSVLKEPMQAKLHSYNGKLCIHTIGPNLRDGRRCTREQAVKELADTYAYIMVEFAQSPTARLLRLLPVCSRSGPFKDEVPSMDVEALGVAFGMLNGSCQDRIVKSEGVELCVYSSQDVPAYAHAFRALN